MKHVKHLRRLVLVGIAICVVLILLAAGAIDTAREKKRRAREQCEHIAHAVKYYYHSTASPASEEDLRPPTLHDLVRPHGCSVSLLANGDADTIDPWGKPYQLQIQVDPEGRFLSVLVSTTAPDGTPITQFGIGRNALLVPE